VAVKTLLFAFTPCGIHTVSGIGCKPFLIGSGGGRKSNNSRNITRHFRKGMNDLRREMSISNTVMGASIFSYDI
jgi:hypothetical protein